MHTCIHVSYTYVAAPDCIQVHTYAPSRVESFGPYKNFRKVLRKLGGLLHFHFPEISAEICLPWSESSSCFRGNKRRIHTTHNAASCIQMLDILLAFRCGCKGERLHLNADAIRC